MKSFGKICKTLLLFEYNVLAQSEIHYAKKYIQVKKKKKTENCINLKAP